MTKKLIVGVAGQAQEELDWVKKKIDERSPKEVGIELPIGYENLEKISIKYGFFSAVADYVREKGASVLPLEFLHSANKQHATNLAMYVRRGDITEDDLRARLSSFKGNQRADPGFFDPKVIAQSTFMGPNYEMALEILDECPDLDAVMERQEAGYNTRREQMISAARGAEPGIIVVGFGHSPVLHKSLAMYEHVLSPQAEECMKKGE